MSRLAKTPVELPKNVKISFDNTAVNVEGPKGKLSMTIPLDVVLENKDNKIMVNRLSDTKQARSNHGTTKRLIENMCAGKKIVTSNATVRGEKFYSEDQFLVVEDLDFSGVKAFLKTETPGLMGGPPRGGRYSEFTLDRWLDSIFGE